MLKLIAKTLLFSAGLTGFNAQAQYPHYYFGHSEPAFHDFHYGHFPAAWSPHPGYLHPAIPCDAVFLYHSNVPLSGGDWQPTTPVIASDPIAARLNGNQATGSLSSDSPIRSNLNVLNGLQNQSTGDIALLPGNSDPMLFVGRQARVLQDDAPLMDGADQLGSIDRGQTLKILDVRGTWIKLETDWLRKNAWIKKDLIEVVSDNSASAAENNAPPAE
ncbi:MAG: hypothetical protein SFX18_02635 [Pirellulales bacterium]|nr:hypothetical protein [Pirellulales bacterium]